MRKSGHIRSPEQPSIAYFVSPHGFGHAARAAAVLEALLQIRPDMRLTIITTVPEWFFRESLSGTFEYVAEVIDVGFIQKNPIEENLPATLVELDKLFPLRDSFIEKLTHTCKDRAIQLIICDISPVGIVIGREAGIPTILVENFTWDWIYREYVDQEKRFSSFAQLFKEMYDRVDCRIQAEPVGRLKPSDLLVSPVSRSSRANAAAIHALLQIEPGYKSVLVTMGGVPSNFDFLEKLTKSEQVHFIIAGASENRKLAPNVSLVAAQSEFYHPDLVQASDVVIGKLGYSTVAEVYNAGVPFGYIPREHFPESPSMAKFVEHNLDCCPLSNTEFSDGSWLQRLPELLTKKKRPCLHENGAIQAARFILDFLSRENPA